MNWLMTEMLTVRPMPARMNWSGWKMAVAKAWVSNLTGLPEPQAATSRAQAIAPARTSPGRSDRFRVVGEAFVPVSLLGLVHLVGHVGRDGPRIVAVLLEDLQVRPVVDHRDQRLLDRVAQAGVPVIVGHADALEGDA